MALVLIADSTLGVRSSARPCHLEWKSVSMNDTPRPEDVPGTSQLLRSIASNDVVILGAGFSREVAATMPLTDELGQEAVRRAGIPGTRIFTGGAFEAWLSRLAESQPYLTPAENLENSSWFQRLTDAIQAVVGDAQTKALSSGLPDWLSRFVRALHYGRATVITFNYDLLIEHLVMKLGLWDFAADYSHGAPVWWTHALGDLPGYPPLPARFSGDLHETFRLLKLHGSLNWFWVPGDDAGITLSYSDLEPTESDLRRFLPGRQPFIVPPASLKSAFFRNPIMHENWRSAAVALRKADRVSLLGYSMPLTDLISSGMISECLTDRTVDVLVVNKSPQRVVDSIRSATQIEATVNVSIPDFADEFVKQTSQRLAHQILTGSGEVPADTGVLVGWARDLMSVAVDVRRVGNTVEVITGQFDDPNPTMPRDAGGPLITLPMLAATLSPEDELVAVFPNARRSVLVGLDAFRVPGGASSRWQVLVPAEDPTVLQ